LMKKNCFAAGVNGVKLSTVMYTFNNFTVV
jgi:sRNA-binding regulator protein Hfq